MGPAATADFLARLVTAAGASRDADHPRVLVDSNPAVPDRNAALAGQGESPGPVLAAMARGLVAAGAGVLAMPCNAAHGWAADVRAEIPEADFISMIDAAVAGVARGAPRRVGLLAVEATRAARLYHAPLEAAGIAVIDPGGAAFAAAIASVKAGDTGPEARAAMSAIANDLVVAGADVVLAACTEVPLVLGPGDLVVPFIDATALLVEATLAAARR